VGKIYDSSYCFDPEKGNTDVRDNIPMGELGEIPMKDTPLTDLHPPKRGRAKNHRDQWCGNVLCSYVDDDGHLWAVAELNTNTPKGKRILENMQNGSVVGLSMGTHYVSVEDPSNGEVLAETYISDHLAVVPDPRREGCNVVHFISPNNTPGKITPEFIEYVKRSTSKIPRLKQTGLVNASSSTAEGGYGPCSVDRPVTRSLGVVPFVVDDSLPPQDIIDNKESRTYKNKKTPVLYTNTATPVEPWDHRKFIREFTAGMMNSDMNKAPPPPQTQTNQSMPPQGGGSAPNQNMPARELHPDTEALNRGSATSAKSTPAKEMQSSATPASGGEQSAAVGASRQHMETFHKLSKEQQEKVVCGYMNDLAELKRHKEKLEEDKRRRDEEENTQLKIDLQSVMDKLIKPIKSAAAANSTSAAPATAEGSQMHAAAKKKQSDGSGIPDSEGSGESSTDDPGKEVMELFEMMRDPHQKRKFTRAFQHSLTVASKSAYEEGRRTSSSHHSSGVADPNEGLPAKRMYGGGNPSTVFDSYLSDSRSRTSDNSRFHEHQGYLGENTPSSSSTFSQNPTMTLSERDTDFYNRMTADVNRHLNQTAPSGNAGGNFEIVSPF
jgi:hypothetical protein